MPLPSVPGNEWVVRRARARLRPALLLVLAVNLAYALAWAAAATLAWLLVRGPRGDVLSLAVTVPMMLLHVPWIWSWPTAYWGTTPDMRANIATSVRLGMERRQARVLCLAGIVSNGLGLAAIAAALFASWLL
jgi:hypothetical protein